MRTHTHCNEILADRLNCNTTFVLSMSIWIWTKSNLKSTDQVTHWHQTCCLCREPLLKMCLSPGAVRSPALSQTHPGVTGHGDCDSASHTPSSAAFSIHTMSCPDYFLRFLFFFFVFVAHGCISFNKERTDGKQGPECLCWTLSWVRSLLSLAFFHQWRCCLCWGQGLVSAWSPWEDCCLNKVGIDKQE